MGVVAVEWFSGVGGMAAALTQADPTATIVAAVDINTLANKTYEYNFHLRPTCCSIDSLQPQAIDTFHANLWLLSPPCQPYTSSSHGC